jgi:hypothetical protein
MTRRPWNALALLTLLGWAMPGLAVEPDRAPPWAATLRAGVFVLYSPGVAGHPAGPDLELSLGHAIYDLVSLEVNAGAYTVGLTGTGTQLTVIPLSVSLKLLAAPEHGFEAYAVAGLGANLTRLSGGLMASTPVSQVAYHAGLGVRRRLGPRYYAGLDGRYLFQDADSPLGRLDGLRLSLLAGALF